SWAVFRIAWLTCGAVYICQPAWTSCGLAAAIRGGGSIGPIGLAEAIADAAHRVDVVGRIGAAFEALAQAHDEVVDGACRWVDLESPHPVEDFFTGHDPLGLFAQNLQDHRFLM